MSGDPNYALILAVRNGNIETAERLIDTYGLSYSAGWSGGYVLLREALENDREIMAKLLLNRGSRVNSKNQNLSNTPLHLAAEKGYTEIVTMLLDRQTIVNAADSCGRTPLFFAVCSGRLETVKLLLDGGAYVDASMTNGTTPLWYAVQNDKLAIVEELLRRGARVNARDSSKYGSTGSTPLYLATTKNNLSMVKLLLTMGADVNDTSEHNETPLHAAIKHSDELVKLLLDKGANVNATGRDDETPLHAAIRRNDKAKVKLLLDRGADVDASMKDGATALRVAVQRAERSVIDEILRFRPDMKNEANLGSLSAAIKAHPGDKSRAIVDVLLRHGFYVRAEDANDTELLHAAVRGGYLTILESLLKLGADANAPLNLGKGATPLHTAIQFHQSEVAELLLNHGANVNAVDEMGRSTLSTAIDAGVASVAKVLLLRSDASSIVIQDLFFDVVKKEDPEILEMLLHSAPHIDVDARDNTGKTALHYFVIKNPFLCYEDEIEEGFAKPLAKAKITEMLLNRGASVNAELKNGMTALHLAAREGYADTVKVLLEKGAHVDHLADRDQTPLHMAVFRNNITVVKMLLDCGANVNARMKVGRTVLHVASGKGCAALVKLLLDRGADPDSQDLQNRSPLDHAVIGCNSGAVGALLRHGTEVTSEDLMRWLTYVRKQIHQRCYDDDYEVYDGYDEYDVNCPWLPITDFLKQHVVAMKALDLRANDLNLRDFDMDNELNCHLESCQREIRKMKSHSIADSNVSFHDVLTGDKNKMAAYARNDNIAQTLAREELFDEFPTYFGMIARRYEQGQKRDRLFSSGAESLYDISKSLTGRVIPDLSAMKILKHLSNSDLERLIEACPIGDDCRN